MNVKNKLLLSCFCFLFINVKPMAEPNGTCWSVPLVSFIITISAGSFNDSKAGTTATFDFGNMSAPYYPMGWCL
ncbi:hypothetical protein [Buttiauxella brennerae]|uniref:hypothetical protein n=1 Tax=Buttiauxella brennerae TaxID=82988 RepID=UPI0012EE7A52|nr:hypothetical protein [Buttiauxella brennerae]